jgi:hypothetical protein
MYTTCTLRGNQHIVRRTKPAKVRRGAIIDDVNVHSPLTRIRDSETELTGFFFILIIRRRRRRRRRRMKNIFIIRRVRKN